MINRTILLLTVITSTAVACEPNYVMDETIPTHVDSEILSHNTLLLKKALLRAANLHTITMAANDIEEKFLAKNGTTAPFSPNEMYREAGQEIVDRFLCANLPSQPIKHSLRVNAKKHIARFIAKL